MRRRSKTGRAGSRGSAFARLALLMAWVLSALVGCARNDKYPEGAGPGSEPKVALLSAKLEDADVLGAEIALLEDPEGTLTYPEVRNKTFLTHGAGVPVLSYTKSSWWFQLELRNDSEASALRSLAIGWPRLNNIEVYAERGPESSKPVDRYVSGWLTPYSERQVAHPAHQFLLEFEPGEQRRIYIGVRSESELFLPLKLFTVTDLSHRTLIGMGVSFMYFGCLLGLGLYNLVLAFRLKHAHHFLYVGQVVFFVSYTMLVGGYFGFFEPLLVLGTSLVSLTMWGWLFFHVAFARSFLNTRTLLPRFDRSLGLAQYGLIPLAAVVDISLLGQQQAEHLLGPLLPLFVLVVLVAAIACMRRGSATAAWYVCAQSLLAAGLVLAGLTFSGTLVVHPGFAGSMVLLSTLAELIVLSIALSEQMRVLAVQQADAIRELQAGRLSALRQLVASVTHELNSPLGSLASSAHSLGRVPPLLSEAAQDENRQSRILRAVRPAVETIQAASQRIERIVQSLKDFSGLDGSEERPHDLNSGLDAAIELLQKKLGGEIQVIKNYGELRPLYCAAASLNQALLHLLANAADALKGQGTLTVTTLETENTAIVMIQDTGVGMDKATLARVLSPGLNRNGQRVHMGLGLPTSRRIVEDQGGTLTLESEEGEGTRVTLRFPHRPAIA